MPTLLRLDEHLGALVRSGAALRGAAAAAGLDAKVPPCPAWDVTELVVHQGMVHRWAAANLRGERGHDPAARKPRAGPLPGCSTGTPRAWPTWSTPCGRRRISDRPIVTTLGATEQPEATFSGTAVQLYLSLWNRAGEITINGRSGLLDQWREQVRIRWS